MSWISIITFWEVFEDEDEGGCPLKDVCPFYVKDLCNDVNIYESCDIYKRCKNHHAPIICIMNEVFG